MLYQDVWPLSRILQIPIQIGNLIGKIGIIGICRILDMYEMFRPQENWLMFQGWVQLTQKLDPFWSTDQRQNILLSIFREIKKFRGVHSMTPPSEGVLNLWPTLDSRWVYIRIWEKGVYVWTVLSYFWYNQLSITLTLWHLIGNVYYH